MQKQDQSLRALKGVGPKMLERFARVGIHSTQDLLFHLPLRYEDRTRLTPIAQLRPNTSALFEGTIKAAGIINSRRRSFVCKLEQDYAVISIRLFHFSMAQTRGLKPGRRLRCFGEIRFGRDSLECFHPQYTLLEDDAELPLDDSLTPVYPSTEGLHQASFRKLIAQLLPKLEQQGLQDLLPQTLLQQVPGSIWPSNGKVDLSLSACLLALHAPRSTELQQLKTYQQRLAFEELLAYHLSLLQMRQRIQALNAPALQEDAALKKRFLAGLGFQLTAAQNRVAAEISHDLSQTRPSLRLVQGDVGSGKTVVAALAAAQAVANQHQVVVMAPTEILAEQHCKAFSDWFQPLGAQVVLLSGQQGARQRREALADIAEGQAAIIVGTHAVIQDAVVYHRLGLIIIDEQHRFGVDQRLQLRRKALESGVCPHQIIMTATPIPRTLAMVAYADLDVSVIDELPPGRTPVVTTVLDNSQRGRIVERVHKACRQGRQAYWVCTLVEESEALQCQAAEKTAEELQKALPDIRIALVHGRQKAAEKATTMQAFKEGEIQLLVATTVIEVGVDVPNASLMIIENSERLGLSQIHQLRGRVGRGSAESFCVLMYQKPLSQTGKQRLETLRSSSDGFYIAEQDLALRGPGEVLGTRQTGMLQFRIADLERDEELVEYVNALATEFVRDFPEHITPLIERWIGDASSYGDA